VSFRFTAQDGAGDPFVFTFGHPPPPGASLSRAGALSWAVPLDGSQFGTPRDGGTFNVANRSAWGEHAITIVATALRTDANLSVATTTVFYVNRTRACAAFLLAVSPEAQALKTLRPEVAAMPRSAPFALVSRSAANSTAAAAANPVASPALPSTYCYCAEGCLPGAANCTCAPCAWNAYIRATLPRAPERTGGATLYAGEVGVTVTWALVNAPRGSTLRPGIALGTGGLGAPELAPDVLGRYELRANVSDAGCVPSAASPGWQLVPAAVELACAATPQLQIAGDVTHGRCFPRLLLSAAGSNDTGGFDLLRALTWRVAGGPRPGGPPALPSGAKAADDRFAQGAATPPGGANASTAGGGFGALIVAPDALAAEFYPYSLGDFTLEFSVRFLLCLYVW
jgi:hypothetical protein